MYRLAALAVRHIPVTPFHRTYREGELCSNGRIIGLEDYFRSACQIQLVPDVIIFLTAEAISP